MLFISDFFVIWQSSNDYTFMSSPPLTALSPKEKDDNVKNVACISIKIQTRASQGLWGWNFQLFEASCGFIIGSCGPYGLQKNQNYWPYHQKLWDGERGIVGY